jgi:L-lactate dehydrogenase complex protein LldE
MQIQLFVTCLVDSFFPSVGQAALNVLVAAGADVMIPTDQTCCGQPAFNAGNWNEARHMARHTIQMFERHPHAIVIPSGSCAAMIRHGYPELFAQDPDWGPRARAVAERVHELSQFLVDVARVINFGAVHEGAVAYHPSCHLLRGLGVDRQPRALLEQIQGARVAYLDPECCGFGGVFSVDHPELSGEMLVRALDRIQSSGSALVTGCDVSCLMHLEGGLRKQGSKVRCAHLAQLLVPGEAKLR